MSALNITTPEDWFHCLLLEDRAVITGMRDRTPPAQLVNPAEIAGKPVTTIGIEAYAHCNTLEQVTFPPTLVEIQACAFDHCMGLTQIHLPEGLVTIGDYAFDHCHALTSVEFPSTLRNICFHGFARCIALTQITLPEGMVVLQEGAFLGCLGLNQVTLPQSLRVIQNDAFVLCKSLAEITLPPHVKVGYFSFGWCDALDLVLAWQDTQTERTSFFQCNGTTFRYLD